MVLSRQSNTRSLHSMVRRQPRCTSMRVAKQYLDRCTSNGARKAHSIADLPMAQSPAIPDRCTSMVPIAKAIPRSLHFNGAQSPAHTAIAALQW
ncbi:hypothetical protein AVEN_105892-1 [Araneus ventricosus]|uniref:Uncharacterized protein n=1 Tax=Araneus ventricosus TaxID=182803 RepID=A0A4Y2M9T8_ARAVE|nr:hypothetical protein AVEN_105892-1 [Araneus ventricosus]